MKKNQHNFARFYDIKNCFAFDFIFYISLVSSSLLSLLPSNSTLKVLSSSHRPKPAPNEKNKFTHNFHRTSREVREREKRNLRIYIVLLLVFVGVVGWFRPESWRWLSTAMSRECREKKRGEARPSRFWYYSVEWWSWVRDFFSSFFIFVLRIVSETTHNGHGIHLVLW